MTDQKASADAMRTLMAVRLEQDSKMTIRCKDWTEAEDFVWTFDGTGGLNKTTNLHDLCPCNVISQE